MGTFNKWSQKIPMNYNSEENSFIVILNVPVGKHEYKFVVDGEEKVDPQAPLASSSDGDEGNNIITVQPASQHPEPDEDPGSSDNNSSMSSMDDGSYSPTRGKGAHYLQQIMQQQQQQQAMNRAPRKRAESAGSPQSPNFLPPVSSPLTQQQQQQQQQPVKQPSTQKRRLSRQPTDSIASDEYGQIEMVFVENKKSPPLLPPHLRYTPLNSSTQTEYDPSILPVPLHVTVNHVYFASEDSVSMIGISQRYRDKFATIVMYRPRMAATQTEEAGTSDETTNPASVKEDHSS